MNKFNIVIPSDGVGTFLRRHCFERHLFVAQVCDKSVNGWGNSNCDLSSWVKVVAGVNGPARIEVVF